MAHDDLDDKIRPPGPGSDDGGEPATLEAVNASLRDRLLRSLADAENTRRRAERSAADARQYAISDFAAELLPVVDNLQRALVAADDQPQKTPGEDALLGGVRATQRLLTAILDRFGVRKIDALGAPFDPMQHEAMTEVDDESRPPRSVVGILEDGYTIHDRLLRPARVIVTKPRPQSPPEADTASGR
jgi:molecular chaperone GrpE